jgi:hypothetical protein
MRSIPPHNENLGVWVTVKFIPRAILNLEIPWKLMRLYGNEIKNGDVVVIHSRVNARGNLRRFGMRPWIYYPGRFGLSLGLWVFNR